MTEPYTTSRNLEAVRLRVLERFCTLLGDWTRAQAFRNNARQTSAALLSESLAPVKKGEKPEPQEQQLMVRSARLNDTLELLYENQQQNWNKSSRYLKENMLEFNEVTRDLTSILKELEYYAVHDPLTRLYNRRYFYKMLEQEIARSERHHRAFCLLLIDIDNFKAINDTYGHLCADSVLQNLSTLVYQNLRSEDILARVGGDELSIILVETESEIGEKVAERLRENVGKTLLEDDRGNCFHLTLSIGISRYPKDAKDADGLLNKADIALLCAKRLGRDKVATLDESGEQAEGTFDSHIYIEKLRTALEEERIILYYQPIIHCDTGELKAYEVLARLYEPSGKIVSASQFISTVEKFGLGRKLGAVMHAMAFDAYNQLIQKIKKPLCLFIGASLSEIQTPIFCESIETTCTKHAFDLTHIVFEVQEREIINAQNITNTKEQLAQLSKKGFSFALADFGGGYDSFHYLRDFPFSYVKLSGSLIRNLLDSKVDSLLVRDTARLCQELGIICIAESVKSEEILKELRAIGIHWAEGYYIGMAAPKMDENFGGLTLNHDAA